MPAPLHSSAETCSPASFCKFLCSPSVSSSIYSAFSLSYPCHTSDTGIVIGKTTQPPDCNYTVYTEIDEAHDEVYHPSFNVHLSAGSQHFSVCDLKADLQSLLLLL